MNWWDKFWRMGLAFTLIVLLVLTIMTEGEPLNGYALIYLPMAFLVGGIVGIVKK